MCLGETVTYVLEHSRSILVDSWRGGSDTRVRK